MKDVIQLDLPVNVYILEIVYWSI